MRSPGNSPAPVQNTKRKAVLLMLGSTIVIACMHSLVRGISQDLHPFVIVFFRNLFGLLVLIPLIAQAGGLSALRTERGWLYAVRAVIGVFAMTSWFYAISRVPLTNATALSFSTAIFATLSAWLFLGEKMRVRRWTAIFVGMFGVLVVLRPDVEGFNSYSLLVIASTVAWGTSITLVKLLSRTDTVVAIIGWMGISLTLLSIWPALLYWQTPTVAQYAVLAGIGALATAGHWLMTSALKMADTAVVMSVDFTRLIWTALIAGWFFGEVLSLIHI